MLEFDLMMIMMSLDENETSHVHLKLTLVDLKSTLEFDLMMTMMSLDENETSQVQLRHYY
jgi:hypothetical protein